MTERKGITRIFNPETQGAVTRQTTVEGRLRESLETKRRIEEEEHPGQHLAETDTADRYTSPRFRESPGSVSIENADAWQEGHGDLANGEEMTGQEGTVPCDLVGRPRDSKTGASGKRTWDR
jgi:hypothetical protein